MAQAWHDKIIAENKNYQVSPLLGVLKKPVS